MNSNLPSPALLHRLFEDTVPHFVNDTAVVFREQQINYGELNRRSDSLCQALLHFAKDQEIIGLSTTRSLEMIVGILAILKSGKAYLPLDPNFPESRLEQVLSSSQIKVCVSISSETATFQNLGLRVIPSDAEQIYSGEAVEQQNSNACVLYTSGSTGKPKGVCVPHQGLVNFLLWQKEHSKAAPYLKTLQFCHLSFDVSIEEIFVPLITGGTLYLINDNYRLDSGNLLNFVEDHNIHRMYLPYVELQYFAEEAIKENLFPKSLLEVITGGELLKITPHISTLFNSLKACPLKNKYGPTEACIWVTELELNGDADEWPEIPTIGKPFANTTIYILNDQLELLPQGEVGEICIQGICTANGYLNEPVLTANAFIHWKNQNNETLRLYKTGDLGRVLPDGNIEFHGRRDGQVKIRGNRIELADIEVALIQQAGVQQAVVIAREDTPGKKYLAAYLVNREAEIDIKQLRNQLITLLPDYMIPSYFIQLEDVPKTPSGKVDRKSLPKPEAKRPDFGILYRKPSTEIEANIANILINLLQFDKVGVDDNFFELGGNSLLAQKAISEIKHQFGYILPITKLYQFPTIAGMATYINSHQFPNQSKRLESFNKQHKPSSSQNNDIAVIAMSGRFPGADSIEELWEVLKNGEETITFFDEGSLDPFIPKSLKKDPMYVKARGIVRQADQFEPEFFGINPKLAELMDPQQRIFMEICWEALEDAGYFPQNGHSDIGVFAGSYNNTYYLNNVQHNKDLVDRIGEFQVMSANEKDYIASRTAYHLNLKGPAISVYSACSTSLLAIIQAVESLRKGQCELALAGGASINSPINSGHLYQEGAMLSANGHCSPFDADSTGTLFSDGAGVVLLKKLEKAKEDGDTIYAVIKGVGVNNDGGEKGSFTAPSATGQAGAIHMAFQDAQVEPSSISYVEAHGTGTPLGDPIEMEGLGIAFGQQKHKQYCAIGSIKSNIGHLTAAAGVAGFIKAVLSLKHQQIPPSLGFKIPNPHIDFANSPFFVNDKLRKWESSGTRRAGVSSFGVGGTNVHAILEEYKVEPLPVEKGRKYQLITWSAKSVKSRDAYANRLQELVKNNPAISLEEVAFTLQTTRAAFNHRRFVVAASLEEFWQELTDVNQPAKSFSLSETPGEVVFSFPGQGSQYINMGKELYEEEPVYKEAVDRCAEVLKEHLDAEDIRQVIFPAVNHQLAEEKLKDTRYTQPALFVTEYALAQLWMSWGVQPSILCGHSLGEYVAAHLAGIFSLEDALKVISARGALISALPRGNMLSIRVSEQKIERLLPAELSIAAVNGKELCVVSGEDEHIAMFAKVLDQHEIPYQLLSTSHAFHSSMMEPIIQDFKNVLQSVQLKKPQKPIVSTVTGTWLTDEQATDASYWSEHVRHTVRFADALDTINSLENPLLIEIGPGKVTSTLAMKQLDPKRSGIVTSMEKIQGQSEIKSLLKAVGRVWLHGVEPHWNAFYGERKINKIELPNYAYNKTRCWVDPPSSIPAPIFSVESARITDKPASQAATVSIQDSRTQQIEKSVKEVLKVSGIEEYHPSQSFLEIGLDSLLLTQVALNLRKEFNLPITFRKLNEEYPTPLLLTQYLDKNLPEDFLQEEAILLPDVSSTVEKVAQLNGSTDLSKAVESINIHIQQLSAQLLHIQQLITQNGVSLNNNTAPLHRPQEIDTPSSPGQSPKKGKSSQSRENEEPSFKENLENHPYGDYFTFPPVPGAKLGKDQQGNPGWFVTNPDEEGGYLQIT